jgi:16S rRNA (uracil1498-N3)-methyltransferase
MSRRRFFADEVAGDQAAVLGEHAWHLSRVLRARVGQEFDIAAGSTVRRGRVTSVKDARVEFALGEPVQSPVLPAVTLLMAIFKFDRMEWAIEKCVELGAARIVPVSAERSEPHLVSAAARRVERWRRLALQASEQSRRSEPPVIDDPLPLPDAVPMPAAARVVLSEAGGPSPLKEVLASSQPPLCLAVGPEGGWTDEETRMFAASGWVPGSLGANILRAETAAIVGLALAISAFE